MTFTLLENHNLATQPDALLPADHLLMPRQYQMAPAAGAIAVAPGDLVLPGTAEALNGQVALDDSAEPVLATGGSGGSENIHPNYIPGESPGDRERRVAAELGLDRLLEGNFLRYIAADPRYGMEFIDGFMPDGTEPLTALDDVPPMLIAAGRLSDRASALALRDAMKKIEDELGAQGANAALIVGELYADDMKHFQRMYDRRVDGAINDDDRIIAVWVMPGSGDILVTQVANGDSSGTFDKIARNINQIETDDAELRARALVGVPQAREALPGVPVEVEVFSIVKDAAAAGMEPDLDAILGALDPDAPEMVKPRPAEPELVVPEPDSVTEQDLEDGGRGLFINILGSTQAVATHVASNFIESGLPVIALRAGNEYVDNGKELGTVSEEA